MNKEQLEEFIKANKFPISELNSIARCVDGRYEGIAAEPAIAKPGADAGDVMAAFGALNLLNLSLPNDVVLHTVVENAGGLTKFCFHTDDHAEHDNAGPGMGCGHMKKASLEPEAYGLKSEQIKYLIGKLPSLIEQHCKQEILHGEHTESAVVVVDSETYGLQPLRRFGTGVESVFVYQKTLHEHQLDKLAKSLQSALAETGVVTEEASIRTALTEAFTKQLMATISRLASGLPVYSVKISDNDIEITE